MSRDEARRAWSLATQKKLSALVFFALSMHIRTSADDIHQAYDATASEHAWEVYSPFFAQVPGFRSALFVICAYELTGPQDARQTRPLCRPVGTWTTVLIWNSERNSACLLSGTVSHAWLTTSTQASTALLRKGTQENQTG
jgi:hypothetical protein